MPRFRKKPVEIEAFQWDGTTAPGLHDWARWPTWFSDAFAREVAFWGGGLQRRLMLQTLEGPMTASQGDWIICGVKGEVYACKPDVFELTYDRVLIYGDATVAIGAGGGPTDDDRHA